MILKSEILLKLINYTLLTHIIVTLINIPLYFQIIFKINKLGPKGLTRDNCETRPIKK